MNFLKDLKDYDKDSIHVSSLTFSYSLVYYIKYQLVCDRPIIYYYFLH